MTHPSLSEPGAATRKGRRGFYVEVRKCDDCGHIGMNDSSNTLSACSACDWSGPTPQDDLCVSCDSDGVMCAACGVCGSRASLITDQTLDIDPPSDADLASHAPQCGRASEFRVMAYIDGVEVPSSCVKVGSQSDCAAAAKRLNRNSPGMTWRALPCITAKSAFA